MTFYSYKGGTGRTMALANVAWILASSGARVVAIDWDLEAPGLPDYVEPFLPGPPKNGLIDHFWSLSAVASDPVVVERADLLSYLPELLPETEKVDYRFPRDGRLEIIRAGRPDELFSERVRDFEWRKFYEDLGGNLVLDAMAAHLRATYDWTLIDSRTGLSDTSGICTVVLPDVVVNCFAPNRQSVRGSAAVGESIHRSRPDLVVYPVACRIERAEDDRLKDARLLWRELHKAAVKRLRNADDYWGAAEIPYVPVYAYQEILACLVDDPGLPDTTLAAYERLTAIITEGRVRRLEAPPSQTWRSSGPAKVLLSYARDDESHVEAVRSLWLFLRSVGVDARLDVAPGPEIPDWTSWMMDELRACDFVLVVVSRGYEVAAEEPTGTEIGRGVAWESRLIRELDYRDRQRARRRVLPVVLPGQSPSNVPGWLTPSLGTVYSVSEFSVTGAESLLRLLTGQVTSVVQSLGRVPTLPVRTGERGAGGGGLRTEVVIRAHVEGNLLLSEVLVAGTVLDTRRVTVPERLWRVWEMFGTSRAPSAEIMREVGADLGRAVLGDSAARSLDMLMSSGRAGDEIDVVLLASGAAAAMPVELMRITTGTGQVAPPLALRPGVTVRRQLADGPRFPIMDATAGPLKILVAIAAPDESGAGLPPLDIEAEMTAVLDAVMPMAGPEQAQVRILEAVTTEQILNALRLDQYHVLHLSAHASATQIMLEDEDGAPSSVDAHTLATLLSQSGRSLPLVMLSTSSGASGGSASVAAELVRRGAQRVIAMQAPVTDRYATAFVAAFYRELLQRPSAPLAQAVAEARRAVEDTRAEVTAWPEYGTVTLFAAGGDSGLIDPDLPAERLSRVAAVPSTQLRELPVGHLIGRRRQLREATSALLRTNVARERWGVTSGVQLTGIAGIGKTALAGRVVARMRERGWLVIVHVGRWNPATFLAGIGAAIGEADELGGLADRSPTAIAAVLSSPDIDGYAKLDLVVDLLRRHRILLVLDDFEQNLGPGGESFADPAFEEVFLQWCAAAETGALLVTSRYPVPGAELDLADIVLPPLSNAELRRLFLRLPAIRDLGADHQRLIIRSIGGHPRLVEFVDALLRGRGAAGIRDVQVELRRLAKATGVDLRRPRPAEEAVDAAMTLGSADILLDELLGVLTPTQLELVRQAAVSPAPMTNADLSFAVAAELADDDSELIALSDDVERLAELTFLTILDDGAVVIHPWTAELIARTASEVESRRRHERALAMRLRRIEEGRLAYGDLVDVPRQLAALRQYDDIAAFADQAREAASFDILASVAYLADVQSLIPEAEPAWSRLAGLEADALATAGNLRAAHKIWERINRQAEVRVSEDPTRPQWQRDLLISQSRLGDLAIAAGDLSAARVAFEASQVIAELLVEIDPYSSARQRDLFITTNRIGGLAEMVGDSATAQRSYETSLAIVERMAAGDPTNKTVQRDLSVGHDRIGSLAVAAGEAESAYTHYRAALNIREQLASADPTNSEWSRDLAVSHTNLGDVAAASGDLIAARSHYMDGLVIRERLAAADAGNMQWERDLSLSLSRVGGVAVAMGDLDAAGSAYQAGLAIAERLAATDPANATWQRDLLIAHERVGSLAVNTGDVATARVHYRASLVIAERLAAADPSNTQRQRDLSVVHGRLGDLAVAEGDMGEARSAYETDLAIATRLAAADPSDAVWQHDLAIAQERLRNLDARPVTLPRIDEDDLSGDLEH